MGYAWLCYIRHSSGLAGVTHSFVNYEEESHHIVDCLCWKTQVGRNWGWPLEAEGGLWSTASRTEAFNPTIARNWILQKSGSFTGWVIYVTPGTCQHLDPSLWDSTQRTWIWIHVLNSKQTVKFVKYYVCLYLYLHCVSVSMSIYSSEVSVFVKVFQRSRTNRMCVCMYIQLVCLYLSREIDWLMCLKELNLMIMEA